MSLLCQVFQRSVNRIAVYLLVCSVWPMAFAESSSSLESYAHGVYKEYLGLQNEALDHYVKSSKAQPSAFAPIDKMSEIQMRLDQKDQALKTVSVFADQFPKHVESQRKAVRLLEATNSYDHYPTDEVLKHLERIEKELPLNTAQLEKRLRILHNAGRPKEAMKLFQQKTELKEAPAGYWLFLLKQASKSFLSRDESAPWEKKILGRLEQTEIHSARHIRSLSEYHRTEGRVDQAVAVLEDFLKRKPGELSIRTRHGILLMHSGQRDDGRDVLLEVISLNPRDALAHSSLARYFKEEGEEEKALDHQAQALELKGGSAYEFVEIAQSYLDQELPKKARLLMEKILYKEPSHVPAKAMLALCLFTEKEYKKAKELFVEIGKDNLTDAKLHPVKATRCILAKAEALIELGDFEDAEGILRPAIRNIEKNDSLSLSKSLSLMVRSWMEQNKNIKPAKSLLIRALKLNKENEEAKQLMEKLQKGN